MIYLFIGSLALVISAGYLGNKYIEMSHELLGWLGGLVSVIAGIAGLSGLVGTTIAGFEYIGAEHRANIINREYGTEYTQEEVFYASNVIDIVRELDRKRYEVNGDIRRQRDPQRDKYQRKPE